MMLDGAPASVDASYIDLVEAAALCKNGDPFLNSSLAHAAVIVQRIIADAYHSVSILSRSLDPRVYGRNQTLDTTSRFLDEAPRRMRILMEEGDEIAHAGNPFLNKFKDRPNVELRIVPRRLQEKYKFHFLVADNESYRFEPDKTKSAAIVAFGHAEIANKLERVFATLWRQCEQERNYPLEFNRGES